jgi:hypothetical protein
MYNPISRLTRLSILVMAEETHDRQSLFSVKFHVAVQPDPPGLRRLRFSSFRLTCQRAPNARFTPPFGTATTNVVWIDREA